MPPRQAQKDQHGGFGIGSRESQAPGRIARVQNGRVNQQPGAFVAPPRRLAPIAAGPPHFSCPRGLRRQFAQVMATQFRPQGAVLAAHLFGHADGALPVGQLLAYPQLPLQGVQAQGQVFRRAHVGFLRPVQHSGGPIVVTDFQSGVGPRSGVEIFPRRDRFVNLQGPAPVPTGPEIGGQFKRRAGFAALLFRLRQVGAYGLFRAPRKLLGIFPEPPVQAPPGIARARIPVAQGGCKNQTACHRHKKIGRHGESVH